ncbi:DUF1932 domain-containing protein [Rhizobium alvei]|uniref:DUF1932 domain-containing protein n=1 Tax=Rhizobium alvei TaxID=1132659 RepID=A0ABT8YSX0_9HYPH|nr:NAD(P)-dependent oxidoreductase [Rhizobium alvei]MDO6966871.1 DUF1932 domain-containing protein [Rhizobium alvei]
MSDLPPIGFVGFGEAAHAISGSWTHDRSMPLAAYDRGIEAPSTSDLIIDRCRQNGVVACATPALALENAMLVFSLVTADQALSAASACAPFLRPGAIWLDGNSCAPGTKTEAARIIEAAGGVYTDMAIMAPVYPKRHQVPILLSGAQADSAADLLIRLGMEPTIAGARVGDASMIKMLRSVMIKGLEALTSECLLAARRAGVDDAVIASLQASDPGIDWRRRGTYNLERMLVHGARRAAEMEEVCTTLRDLGLPDWISSGTVTWQRHLSQLDLAPGEDIFAERADRVLSAL